MLESIKPFSSIHPPTIFDSSQQQGACPNSRITTLSLRPSPSRPLLLHHSPSHGKAAAASHAGVALDGGGPADRTGLATSFTNSSGRWTAAICHWLTKVTNHASYVADHTAGQSCLLLLAVGLQLTYLFPWRTLLSAICRASLLSSLLIGTRYRRFCHWNHNSRPTAADSRLEGDSKRAGEPVHRMIPACKASVTYLCRWKKKPDDKHRWLTGIIIQNEHYRFDTELTWILDVEAIADRNQRPGCHNHHQTLVHHDCTLQTSRAPLAVFVATAGSVLNLWRTIWRMNMQADTPNNTTAVASRQKVGNTGKWQPMRGQSRPWGHPHSNADLQTASFW